MIIATTTSAWAVPANRFQAGELAATTTSQQVSCGRRRATADRPRRYAAAVLAGHRPWGALPYVVAPATERQRPAAICSRVTAAPLLAPSAIRRAGTVIKALASACPIVRIVQRRAARLHGQSGGPRAHAPAAPTATSSTAAVVGDGNPNAARVDPRAHLLA
jgi:hypothetical protein